MFELQLKKAMLIVDKGGVSVDNDDDCPLLGFVETVLRLLTQVSCHLALLRFMYQKCLLSDDVEVSVDN